MKKIKKIVFLTAITSLFTACTTGMTPNATPTSTTPTPPPQTHWSYKGKEGPQHWGELSPYYAACKMGKHQSPIDISNTSKARTESVVFHYQPSEVNIFNNGHTVQVNYDAGSYMKLNGVRYDITQFHFHTPSEHTINGKFFPAELHIVHKNANGHLAVVGLLLNEGANNPAFAPFIEHLPTSPSDIQDAGVTINAADLLPRVRTAFRYSGSLTTPPCSENVSWLVMTAPVALSSEQLNRLTHIFEKNNRPVQPLNGRILLEDN